MNIDDLSAKLDELITAISENSHEVKQWNEDEKKRDNEKKKKENLNNRRSKKNNRNKNEQKRKESRLREEDAIRDDSTQGRYSKARKEYHANQRALKRLERDPNADPELLKRARKRAERSKTSLDRERRISSGKGTVGDKLKSNFSAKANTKGGGKGAMLNLAAEGFNQLLDFGTDMFVAQKQKEQNIWKAEQEALLKTLDTGSKIFNRRMQLFGKGLSSALSVSFAGITEGIQEGAFAAAHSAIDLSTTSYSNMLETQSDMLSMLNANRLTMQQAELENLKITNQQIAKTADLAKGVLDIADVFIPGASAVGTLLTGVANSYIKMSEATSTIAFERAQMEAKIEEEKLRALNEAKSSAVEILGGAVDQVVKFSNDIEKSALKTDEMAKNMANVLGISAQNIAMFKDFVYDTSTRLKIIDSTGKTTYLNKTPEDLAKSQSGYIDATGRNMIMNQNDHVRNFMLGAVLGDDALATSLVGSLDYFNKSVETGTDLIYDMFQQANKAGVSNRKFAKDLQQNLKLAQKYTFKGGVEGMMKMAIWAQKTRFNMESLNGMIDKIQNGGLEGVITQSAKLQVLGGTVAMGADPIAMAYEAWSDPEGLSKRFNAMLDDFGVFNSETGEVDIKGANAQRLKATADAMGMDYADARAQVTQKLKGNQIDKQISGSTYTDEQKALIYSKAQLNKQTGRWEVTLDNNEKADVSNLTESDFVQLMPVQERIEDYVAKIYSLINKQAGAQINSNQRVAQETDANTEQNIQQRIDEGVSFVDKNLPTLKEMVIKGTNFTTEQFAEFHSNMLKYQSVLDEGFTFIKTNASKIADALAEGESEIRLAIAAAIEQVKTGKEWTEKDDELAKEIYKTGPDVIQISQDMVDKAAKAWTDLYENGWYNDADDVVGRMGEIISLYEEKGANNVYEYSELFKDWTHDLLDAMDSVGMINGEEMSNVTPEMIHALVAAIYSTNDTNLTSKQSYDSLKSNAQRLQSDNSIRKFKIVDDSALSGNGNSMFISANKVTPVNDGTAQFVQSDPQDHAIFAKIGGPFDTLFNDIFGEIRGISNFIRKDKSNLDFESITLSPLATNGIFNTSDDISVNSVESLNPLLEAYDSLGRSFNQEKRLYEMLKDWVNPIYENGEIYLSGIDSMKLNTMSDKTGVPFEDLKKLITERQSNITTNSTVYPVEPSKPEISPEVYEPLSLKYSGGLTQQSPLSNNGKVEFGQPLRIELNGKLELGSNGQSIDIMKEIQNNPILLRNLTQMISEAISKNIGGGKTVFNGGQLVGGLGFSSHST